MDAQNVFESSTRSARDSLNNFTDEIEGELEKVSICGVHMTRSITISILGLFAIISIMVGVTFGVTRSSSSIDEGVDYGAFREDHRYLSLGEVIESTVGNKIYENTTYEHEALVWLADTDPIQINVKSPIEDILQRFTVANFYFATNGAGWTDQFNFLSNKDVCDWNDKTSGVFCNDGKKVSDIFMAECNLAGTIPHDIGLLSHMEVLNLTRNELEGDIPVSFGIMSSLKRVDLSKNFFSGQMPPSVAMLLDLVVLDLSFNSLVGGDGASALKDLPSIEEIYLSHNNLTGNIGQLGKSETLRIIDLSSNSIRGKIPRNFGDGKNLKYLNLSDNELSGVIPDVIGNLQSLVELDLSDNKLTGSLHSNLGDLTMLQTLKLNSNNLQYGIPTEFGNLHELSMLELSNNGIESIPGELFSLKNLQTLSLSYNRISGSLPLEVGLASSLMLLDLSHNKFSNKLPNQVDRLVGLEYLFLNDNRFDGTISSELSNLFLLRAMDISNNHFFGDMDIHFCGDRPAWGSPIESYRADCLTEDLSFSCATVCCDGESYCCDMPDQTDCKMQN